MIAYEMPENPRTSTAALIARVSAGEPLEIASDVEQVDLNYLLTRGSESCVLIRVDGDSMIDVPIAPGDWVMLDRSRTAKPNDIVLAYLNGGVTLKRHKLNSGGRNGLYLVAANSLYEAKKITPEDDFEIAGVVTHIIHPTI